MIGQRELDSGGVARLDVSDLLNDSVDTETNGDTDRLAAARDLCAWCAEEQAPGEYLVVADNRNFSVCPTCWGRSAGYLELRQAGLAHEAALGHMSGRSA
jgi:hypothetical protein